MGLDLSLPVMWSVNGAPARPGRLDLSVSTLRLEGGRRAVPHDREIDLAEIEKAFVGRRSAQRIGGRSTLVLELRGGETVRIAGVERPGAVRELAERILQTVSG